MNCSDLSNDYAAWALGIAEDPERQEIAAHIARECPECTSGVQTALTATAFLAAGVKLQTPPAGLRRRVLAMVDRKKPTSWVWSVLPWGVVGLLSIILLAVAIPADRQGKNYSRLEEAMAIVNDPATKDVTFGKSSQQPKGRVFVSSTGVVFIGANLPKLGDGKTYELWVIPVNGKPVPAGTFDGQGGTSAFYVYTGSTTGAGAIAVTLEPEGGSPQPTTTPFIVSKL